MAGSARTRQQQPDILPKLTYCRECGELVVSGAIGGPARCRYWLSRISVSANDAAVLRRHGHVVYNIYRRAVFPGWVAANWLGPKPPKRGRLYAEHICGVWR